MRENVRDLNESGFSLWVWGSTNWNQLKAWSSPVVVCDWVGFFFYFFHFFLFLLALVLI